ncbi:MAG TPA: hypothetical protein PLQ76_02450 [bacterium]|nr:hypothetical protein [bacterium]
MTRLFLLRYSVKRKIAEIALLALGVTFEYLSRSCAALKKEIDGWEEGRVFALSVLPDGPAISLKKEGGAIRYLGRGLKQPNLTFYFKNIDSALMVFVGMMGAHTASVQHRTIVHGDIGTAMEALRAMNVVQTYLMPGFVLKSTFKRPPKLSIGELLLKAWVMLRLVPGLIAAASR